MLVRELIARLQAVDPELPVIMPTDPLSTDRSDYCEVENAFIDTVAVIDGAMSLADERDRDLKRVIRLFGPETEFTAIAPLDG